MDITAIISAITETNTREMTHCPGTRPARSITELDE